MLRYEKGKVGCVPDRKRVLEPRQLTCLAVLEFRLPVAKTPLCFLGRASAHARFLPCLSAFHLPPVHRRSGACCAGFRGLCDSSQGVSATDGGDWLAGCGKKEGGGGGASRRRGTTPLQRGEMPASAARKGSLSRPTCYMCPPASASRWRKMTTSRRPWQTQGLVLHKGQLERSHSLAGRASQTWKQTVRCGCTSKVRADRRSITVFPSIGSCLARNQAPSAAACYLWSVSLTVLVEAATVATAVVAADPARLSAYRHPRRPNPPSAASISS